MSGIATIEVNGKDVMRGTNVAESERAVLATRVRQYTKTSIKGRPFVVREHSDSRPEAANREVKLQQAAARSNALWKQVHDLEYDVGTEGMSSWEKEAKAKSLAEQARASDKEFAKHVIDRPTTAVKLLAHSIATDVGSPNGWKHDGVEVDGNALRRYRNTWMTGWSREIGSSDFGGRRSYGFYVDYSQPSTDFPHGSINYGYALRGGGTSTTVGIGGAMSATAQEKAVAEIKRMLSMSDKEVIEAQGGKNAMHHYWARGSSPDNSDNHVQAANIRQHTKTSKAGKTFVVRQHDDSRPEARSSEPRDATLASVFDRVKANEALLEDIQAEPPTLEEFTQQIKDGVITAEGAGHPFRGNQYTVGHSNVAGRPWASRNSKGELIATFKDKASAHDDVAERYAAAGRNDQADEHKATAEQLRQPKPKPDEDKVLFDRMRRNGVEDITGALADHFHSDPEFVRDVGGDRVCDELVGAGLPSDDAHQAAVWKHLAETKGSQFKKAAAAHNRGVKQFASHSPEIEKVADRVAQHIDEAAGQRAWDINETHGGHRRKTFGSEPVSAGAPRGNRNAAGKREFTTGQTLRFDGKAADGRAEGFFDVEVVDPHSNRHLVGHTDNRGEDYDKDGRHVIRTATVKNKRSGHQFEAYHYTLRDLATNKTSDPTTTDKCMKASTLPNALGSDGTDREEDRCECGGGVTNGQCIVCGKPYEAATHEEPDGDEANPEAGADNNDDDEGTLPAHDDGEVLARGSMRASGTSAGVRKSWETRRSHFAKQAQTSRRLAEVSSDYDSAAIHSKNASAAADKVSEIADEDGRDSESHDEASNANLHAMRSHQIAANHAMRRNDAENVRFHRAKAQVHGARAEKHAGLSDLAYDDSPPGVGAAQPALDHFVRCTDVGFSIKAKKVWEPGKPIEFQWMPGGIHTITASYGRGADNKPIKLTVLCDKDAADRIAASFKAIKSESPRRPPFICVEHQAKERAGEPLSFAWKNYPEPAIYCTCEPSALGATNVNGKIHTSFSPTFDTDADYSRLKDVGGVWVFPEGVRGSESNPARVTRLDAQSVGSLTNWNAFKEILPIAARQPNMQAGAPLGNKNAAGPRGATTRQKHVVKIPLKVIVYKRNPNSKYKFWDGSQDVPADREEVTVNDVPHQVESDDYGDGRTVGTMQHPDLYNDILPLAKQQHGDSVFQVGGFTWSGIDEANKRLGFGRNKASDPDPDPLLDPIFATRSAADQVIAELADQVEANNDLPSAAEGNLDEVFAKAQATEELIEAVEVLPKTKEQRYEELMAAVATTVEANVFAGAPFGNKNAKKFGVYRRGGSLGDNRSNSHPKHGVLVAEHDSEEVANEDAKRKNKHLSPGEKQYYKIRYHSKPIGDDDGDDEPDVLRQMLNDPKSTRGNRRNY